MWWKLAGLRDERSLRLTPRQQLMPLAMGDPCIFAVLHYLFQAFSKLEVKFVHLEGEEDYPVSALIIKERYAPYIVSQRHYFREDNYLLWYSAPRCIVSNHLCYFAQMLTSLFGIGPYSYIHSSMARSVRWIKTCASLSHLPIMYHTTVVWKMSLSANFLFQHNNRNFDPVRGDDNI